MYLLLHRFDVFLQHSDKIVLTTAMRVSGDHNPEYKSSIALSQPFPEVSGHTRPHRGDDHFPKPACILIHLPLIITHGRFLRKLTA